MSNCLLQEEGLPIVRAASRLALRATARGAASALTRHYRCAVCSSYGRHGVPVGVGAIHPGGAIAQHGVERDDHLAHHGNYRDFWFLPGIGQVTVKGLERRIESEGGESCHIEHGADGRRAAVDAAVALQLPAIEI